MNLKDFRPPNRNFLCDASYGQTSNFDSDEDSYTLFGHLSIRIQ